MEYIVESSASSITSSDSNVSFDKTKFSGLFQSIEDYIEVNWNPKDKYNFEVQIECDERKIKVNVFSFNYLQTDALIAMLCFEAKNSYHNTFKEIYSRFGYPLMYNKLQKLNRKLRYLFGDNVYTQFMECELDHPNYIDE